MHRKSIRLDMTRLAWWSTENSTRNWSLTMRTNGICTTQNQSRRMRCTNERIGKGTGVLINKKKTSGNHPNYSITEIGKNTEKSSGDSRRLAVTQTPMRYHRLTQVWKTRKGVTIIEISECCKLAQKKFKIKHNWVGKVITKNYARNWNSTIWTNGIRTTQNISWRMRHPTSSGILR